MLAKREHYDVLVLGSGEAGKYIAWSSAMLGRSAAVIERRYIGGSCPNIACLPSKNIVHTAKVVHTAAQAASYGLPEVQPGVKMEVVRDRKRAMVNGLIAMHEDRFHQSGAELILGEGRFVDPKSIEVTLASGETCILTGGDIVVICVIKMKFVLKVQYLNGETILILCDPFHRLARFCNNFDWSIVMRNRSLLSQRLAEMRSLAWHG
jgi:pyruvate/2-oxoglutarate dehydrogenase complex dihydrolipoamide dehydrogenase (E3) component